jgi:hypothetical protein
VGNDRYEIPFIFDAQEEGPAERFLLIGQLIRESFVTSGWESQFMPRTDG